MAGRDVQPVGTASNPRYFDGYMHRSDGEMVRGRLLAYRTENGVVSGSRLTAIFTIDRPVTEVWEQFKDFNRWQNSGGYYYSPGLIGDVAGKTFRLSTEPNDGGPHQYEVLEVIPHYLIVIHEPAPEHSPAVQRTGGLGGVRPGFHAFALDDYDGQTSVTLQGEHISLAARGAEADAMTDEEAADRWRAINEGAGHLWVDHFIPTLRGLVYEA